MNEIILAMIFGTCYGLSAGILLWSDMDKALKAPVVSILVSIGTCAAIVYFIKTP